MTNTTKNQVELLTIFEAIAKTEGRTKEVLEAIADKGLFIDNHDGNITVLSNEKFALLLLGDRLDYVCPAFKNTRFCMNEMYVDDGYAHLSRVSVAGNLPRCKTTQDLIDACNEYNEEKVCGAGVSAVIEL